MNKDQFAGVRVALFGNTESPHVQRWVESLVSHGIEVLLIGRGKPPSGMPCRSIRFRGPMALGSLLGVLQTACALMTFRPHLLHFHYLGWTSLYALMTHIPYVASPWGSDVYHATNVKKQIVQRVLRRARAITTTCSAMTKALVDLGVPADDTRINMFSWGVNTGVFAPATRQMRDRLRQTLGLPRSKIVVMLPRSLTPLYRGREIIQLVASMSDDIAGKLHICIFKGFASSDEYMAGLASVLAKTRVSHEVVRGPLSATEMGNYLRCADVAISAPLSDQRSSTVLECLGCVPEVVVSECEVYREIEASGYRLRFLPSLDPVDEHSRCVLREALLSSQAEVAQDRLEANWSLLRSTEGLDRFDEAVSRLYRDVLPRGQG